MTDAHEQHMTVHLLEHYPAHDARECDPHYHAFEAAKRRIKEAGLWKCNVCGSTEHVELHHTKVEFAYQNGIDVAKLDEAFGLHLDDESFKDWIESPDNLEPLCVRHHRGSEAVHSLPEPVWNILRIWRDDLPPPAEVV